MSRSTLFVGLTVLALAGAVQAQYTGPWNHEWDFESGLQGWTITGGGYYYNGGGSGPALPDGGASGYGSSSLHLTDGSYARLNLADIGATDLGADGTATTGKQGFVLQADAWLPNLRPLSGFPAGAPGNALTRAGLGVEGTRVALYAEGRADSNIRGLTARDFGWDNSARNRSNVLVQYSGGAALAPDTLWWDSVITFQIDYNYTEAGKWTAWGYVPFENQLGAAGWYKMSNGSYPVHPDGSAATFLQLGGAFSWTQAQFDNVKLAYVPEPATVAFLALGGLLLRRRRSA